MDRKQVGYVLLRSGVQYVAFLLISFISSSIFVLCAEGLIRELHGPMSVIYAISSVTLLFPFYTAVRSFELYNLKVREAFLGKVGEIYTLRADISAILHVKEIKIRFFLDLALTATLVFILPYEIGYIYVMSFFRDAFALGATELYLIKGAIMCPLLSVLLVLAKTSAHKWWIIARTGEREKMDNLKRPKVRLFLELLKALGIYSVSSVALPTVIMLLVSFALTLGLLSEQTWIIPLVIAVIIVVLVWRNIFTLRRRRKFYKRFLRAAEASGWTVECVNSPIRSSVSYRPGASFVISKGDKRYAVRLASAKRRGLPVFVSPDGYYTVKNTISFLKITLFHIMTDVEYGFESDAKKIVVFSPMPKRIFINYGRTDTALDDGDGGTLPTAVVLRAAAMGGNRGKSIHGPGYVSDVDRGIIKPFETGDVIGDYKFFTPSGFISAMENDCLDR